jgi:hypothetical protein
MQAIKSIEIVTGRMPDEHIVKYFTAFVVRLATKDW